MIPVNSKAEDIVEPNPVPMTMVPPVAAAEDRALSEMKTEKEKPHVKVRKIIKRRKRKSVEKNQTNDQHLRRKRRKHIEEKIVTITPIVWNRTFNKKRKK